MRRPHIFPRLARAYRFGSELFFRTGKFAAVISASLLISSVLSAGHSSVKLEDEFLIVSLAAPEAVSRARGHGDATRSRVTLPRNSSEQVKMKSSTKGLEVQLRLPFAERNASAKHIGNEFVSFDNGNGSKTVPLPQGDGSVAVHTIIASISAPTVYDYEVKTGSDIHLKPVDGGGILIVDGTGSFVAAVAPPWAKDATGAKVETHYEIHGSKIRQIVKHSLDGLKYPVVADPYLGVDLFSSTWWTGSGRSLVAHLNTTPMMGVAFAAGHAFTFGWPEAVAKMGNTLRQENLYQQFACHANGAPFASSGASPSWDLENYRGTTWNYAHFWVHRCNW